MPHWASQRANQQLRKRDFVELQTVSVPFYQSNDGGQCTYGYFLDYCVGVCLGTDWQNWILEKQQVLDLILFTCGIFCSFYLLFWWRFTSESLPQKTTSLITSSSIVYLFTFQTKSLNHWIRFYQMVSVDSTSALVVSLLFRQKL